MDDNFQFEFEDPIVVKSEPVDQESVDNNYDFGFVKPEPLEQDPFHHETEDNFLRSENNVDDEATEESKSEVSDNKSEYLTDIPDIIRQNNGPDKKRRTVDPEHDVQEYATKIAKVFSKSEIDRLNVENSDLKDEVRRQNGQIEALMQNRRKLIAREKELINQVNGLRRKNDKQKQYIKEVLAVVSTGYSLFAKSYK